MSVPNPGPSGPLASVVVACLDRPAATRRCVAALLRHTRRPWELITVARPGGEAWAYLSGVRDAAPVPVALLEAPASPRPLLAAHRAGAVAARGAYIVLVRNTVVVTDAWLDQLAALAEMDGAIGLAGPMTAAAPAPQRAGAVPSSYGDAAGLARFASAWRRERRGKWQEADSLAGGCVLVKRRVLEPPGGGRLRVRPEGLRRPRLATRARRLGYRMAVAHDLYVHQDAPGGPDVGGRARAVALARRGPRRPGDVPRRGPPAG